MLLPVTAVYAAILALFVVVLIVPVIVLRRRLRIGLGDGGNKSLQQAIRVHGNAIEVIPIFLILLIVGELNRASPWLLHGFGMLFLLARLSHAAGLYQSSGATRWRIFGTLGTLSALVGLAIVNVVRVLSAG